MTDREKVIKGLELCLASIDEAECPEECPYYETCRNYENRVIFQPVMRDAMELLKEQETIVRCKDCKYCEYPKSEKEWCKKGHLHGNAEHWYCADGERR